MIEGVVGVGGEGGRVFDGRLERHVERKVLSRGRSSTLLFRESNPMHSGMLLTVKRL